MVVHDPAAGGPGDLEPPAPAPDAAGRSVLAQLLAPLGANGEALAERLIHRFGSLGATLHAPGHILERVANAEVRGVVTATREAIAYSLRERILADPIAAPTDALIAYLIGTMGDCPREQVRMLYLDSGNYLIRDEIAAEGSPNQTFLSPRVIIARALELEATALLIIHNHPGGTPEPTPADITFTKHLARVAKDLGMVLHDHLIIAGDRWLSLRAARVLK